MAEYAITAVAKIRDIVQAKDAEQAVMLFKARYPEMADKDAKILDVNLLSQTQEE